jgi:Cu+-exporting ATPase
VLRADGVNRGASGEPQPFIGLLVSPIVAAGAMSFISVSVIGNALRLKWEVIE